MLFKFVDILVKIIMLIYGDHDNDGSYSDDNESNNDRVGNGVDNSHNDDDQTLNAQITLYLYMNSF